MNTAIDEKATMIATEITMKKTERAERVVQTEIEIETETVDFIEIEKESGIENEIDTDPEEDREVVVRDGRRRKEKVVNEIDIGMTIETVIGIGFSEWF